MKSVIAAVFLLVLSVGAAQAGPINLPVPSNAYITLNGLDWAWASPVAADGSWGALSAIDLSYQVTLGWRLPTAEELLTAPRAIDFVFSGGNVPLVGRVDPVSGAYFDAPPPGDAALAVPYFSDLFKHGDWSDSPGVATP